MSLKLEYTTASYLAGGCFQEINIIMKYLPHLEEIRDKQMNVEDIRKRFNLSYQVAQKWFYHANKKDLNRVGDKELHQEAINNVKKWKDKGSPRDRFGRIPIELLGDIKIAKKYEGFSFKPPK